MLAENTVLQGRYKIIRTVGQGGMGAVYMARDLRLNNVVALKENFFNDEKMMRAFQHEAQLLAGLRHSALPKVFDHFSEGDRQFLVMEFIFGDDFAEVLQKRKVRMQPVGLPKPFEPPDVINWAEQLLDALDYLHNQSQPIIHRDIKPQNLKLGYRNQVTLLDFGLAKGSATHTAALRSNTGSVAGYTPSYAPIEQIQGVGTEPRTDIYSLGATLYHLVTGVPPIGAAIRAEAFLGGEADPLRRPHLLNPKVPLDFSHLLMRAMEQHRNNRPSSAAEMLEQLRALNRRGVNNANYGRDPEVYVPDIRNITPNQQRQTGAQMRQAVTDAEHHHRQLAEAEQRANLDAERLRLQEELARKAREETEQLQIQETAARKAREDAELRRRQLEEQARKAQEEAERFYYYEEQARQAREEMEQNRQLPSANYKTRTDEPERMRLLEEQERRARQEAELLRQRLEEQARKAEAELELRRIQEEEAQRARLEAERLRREEQQRKAREDAERRRLEAELERKAQEEAELQKVLVGLERAAREEAQRQRLLQDEARRAIEEAEQLKHQLDEQSARVKAEAERRRNLEAEIQKAREEAESRRLEEERKRREMEANFGMTAELRAKMNAERKQYEAQAAQQAFERRQLEEELARLTQEEAERRKLERQVRAASEEAELLKQNLEAQEQRAREEAERRQYLEEQARAASDELRKLKEQEAERQATADAERLQLQDALARLAYEEAEKHRVLEEQAVQAAREASLLRRQIEEQTRKASQEAALLKQQLEEISRKAAEEAEKRRQLEEEARLEAERRRQLEEQARLEAEKRRQMEEESRHQREEAEQHRLQEEEARRLRRETERRQREEQERLAQEEMTRLKRELEEQKRLAQQEAEARHLVEAQERKAQQEAEVQRILQEQKRLEALRRSQQESQKYQTRELVAPGYDTRPFDVATDEISVPPPAISRPLFAQSVEAPSRRHWIIGAGALVVLLLIGGLIAFAPKPKTPPLKPALASLISDDSYVKVPKGKFKMGADNSSDPEEKPAHLVEITKDYEIGKYEVTQAEWMALMDKNPAQQRGDNKPVTHLNYAEAYQFIQKLNKLDPAHVYDLPTEAEWEYACRAGTTGDFAGDVKEMAWYKNNSDSTIHPVGSKKPNAWGIYDMHGNVAEWCKDYFDPKYYGKDRSTKDPECVLPVPGYTADRVVRGGGYSADEKYCRSAYRVNNSAINVSDYVGFRLVRRPNLSGQ